MRAWRRSKELIEAFEEEGEDHGDEDELPAMLLAIVTQVEDGQMEAGDAIEAIEALTSEGEDEHAGHGHGIRRSLTSGSTPYG